MLHDGIRSKAQLMKNYTADELVKVWQDQASQAYAAMQEASKAIKAAPWWQHPVLWVSVGFAVATILTVTIAYSLRAVYQPSP